MGVLIPTWLLLFSLWFSCGIDGTRAVGYCLLVSSLLSPSRPGNNIPHFHHQLYEVPEQAPTNLPEGEDEGYPMLIYQFMHAQVIFSPLSCEYVIGVAGSCLLCHHSAASCCRPPPLVACRSLDHIPRTHHTFCRVCFEMACCLLTATLFCLILSGSICSYAHCYCVSDP